MKKYFILMLLMLSNILLAQTISIYGLKHKASIEAMKDSYKLTYAGNIVCFTELTSAIHVITANSKDENRGFWIEKDNEIILDCIQTIICKTPMYHITVKEWPIIGFIDTKYVDRTITLYLLKYTFNGHKY